MPGQFINALTIDVEDYFQVAALSRDVNLSDWDDLPSRVAENTDRILGIFAEADVKATFFVLGWIAKRFPEIVQRICGEGHELACHGYSHQLIYTQEPKVFKQETRDAKSILEDISGRAVTGYRAASYSITRKSVWALDALVEAGFTYDSSIVPARHDLYGMPGAEARPHRLMLEDGRSLVEFPPSTLSIFGQRLPIGGGGYFRLFPYWFSRWGLNRINQHDKMPFSFYLHPWDLDPGQPRIKTNLKSRVRHYTNLHKCEPRLRKLLKGFQFATMRSILEQLTLPEVQARSLVRAKA